MPSAHQFAMPDIGEGLTEAEIVNWQVAVGDVVAINQIIVEVETAKAVVELPSPYAGTVLELHYPQAATVPVGQPIITISANSDQSADTASESEDGAVRDPHAEPPKRREPVLVGYGTTETVVARRPRREASTADGPPPKTTRAYAKPPVRKLARELGIDLHAVPASGRHGEVTRADLTAAAMVRSANQAPPAGAQLRIPVKGVRKYSAHAMVSSAFTAPHVTEWVSADVTKTLALLARVRADSAFDGVRISPLTLIARATLLTIQRHPEINASWDAGTGEIVQYRDVNLGIAAATPRGLIVPNIAAAQSLSFRDLAAALNDLITAARTGKTKPEEMQGGTFTITNIGTFGVDGGTPILNPGEAAILCLGQIRKQPWSHKGRVRLRDVTTLAMSFDHRLVDGELGSRVLADIAGLLERPERALAWY